MGYVQVAFDFDDNLISDWVLAIRMERQQGPIPCQMELHSSNPLVFNQVLDVDNPNRIHQLERGQNPSAQFCISTATVARF